MYISIVCFCFSYCLPSWWINAILCHPDLTYIVNFWHSDTLVLSTVYIFTCLSLSYRSQYLYVYRRYYSAPVGERSIAISLSVCLCLSVREHISGTAGPIFKKCCVQIPCGRGAVLFWRRCDTLRTSGFVDDVTFGRNGPYGDAWKAEPLTYYH